MRLATVALLAVLLVAGCIGQTAPAAPGVAAAPIDGDTAAIADDLNSIATDTSDLSTPDVDLGLP